MRQREILSLRSQLHQVRGVHRRRRLLEDLSSGLYEKHINLVYPQLEELILAFSGRQLMWCVNCGPTQEGWCDFQENARCNGRPICDENDENCEETTTLRPSVCDNIPCPPTGIEDYPEGACEHCWCKCVNGRQLHVDKKYCSCMFQKAYPEKIAARKRSSSTIRTAENAIGTLTIPLAKNEEKSFEF